jgi:hypothetical protein
MTELRELTDGELDVVGGGGHHGHVNNNFQINVGGVVGFQAGQSDLTAVSITGIGSIGTLNLTNNVS